MAIEEKRKYPRLDLGIEDGYFGNFEISGNGSIVAPIINISAGGINIAASESDQEKINDGDVMLLKNIAGGTSLSFLSHIKSEIRWVKMSKALGYLAVGCRFKEIDNAALHQLIQFVDSERVARGQYG